MERRCWGLGIARGRLFVRGEEGAREGLLAAKRGTVIFASEPSGTLSLPVARKPSHFLALSAHLHVTEAQWMPRDAENSTAAATGAAARASHVMPHAVSEPIGSFLVHDV